MPRRLDGPSALALLLFSSCGASSEESGAPAGGGEPVREGARPVAPDPDDSDRTGGFLVEVTHAAGLDFVHESGGEGGFHMPEIISGGAAVLDADADGRLDLYLVSGGADASRPTERGGVENELWRNEGGMRFARVPGAGGATGRSYGMGAAVGDANGDGHPDLYLTNLGPDELWLGDGGAGFREAPSEGAGGWSCSAAFFDREADGDLDLFVVRYVAFDPAGRCFDSADRPEYCGPKSFEPWPDVLLVGDGEGGFVDASGEAGIAGAAAAGLGVAIGDFDEDGATDVYVANDAYANHLWLNAGDGTFVDDALLLGAAFNMNGQAEAGMGVVAADLDDDGASDLFMTHLVSETNTYYRNLGAGTGFVDATGRSGLAQTSMIYTGFGVAAFDVELDGDLDLFVANGRVKKGEPVSGSALPAPWNRYAEPNLFYLNQGGGRFRAANDLAAALTGRIEISRSAALGDLDADGDQDLVLVNAEGRARLYRNDAPRDGRVLVLDVREGARAALGARVQLVAGEYRRLRTVTTSGGFQSASDPRVPFGVPDGVEETGARAEVTWVGGDVEAFELESLEGEQRLVRGEGRALP